MSLPARLYPSDLSDREWEILVPLAPPAKPGGRPRKWPMRKDPKSRLLRLEERLPVVHASALVPALV
jgi:transposase